MYVQIKKNNLSVSDKNGAKVKLPARVQNGMRNYRFETERQMLQKKCIHCNTYFDTDQIIEGAFVDVHDETLIKEHNGKSEMYSRCVKCHEALKEEQIKRDAEKYNVDFSERIAKRSLTEVEHSADQSNKLNLTDENLVYVKHIAVIKNLTEENCLNDLVEKVRRQNKLKIEYDEKI